MIHVKDINAITGYIRGGCTAIGMKKQYVTRIDESSEDTGTNLCQRRQDRISDPIETG